MQPCVKLETTGIVDLDELVRLFEYHGAEKLRLSTTTGSAGEGVQRHFLIEFDDSSDPERRRRYAAGFHAFPNDQNEYGWTRVSFGADDRALELLSEIGHELGGKLFDQRDNDFRVVFEPQPAFAMA
jgi:hypothetical protein